MSYVIRGEKVIFESTEIGKEGQEESFPTIEQAETALEQLQMVYPHIPLKIVQIQ
ncbi:hypothetical protein OA45_05616 [Bacillus sp. UMTAT18]|uniref:hypothetical protein n=1 Tax=Bacillus sp. UMTAT18 TaxID=1565146 RepID=UPI00061F873D|nr:hypothetical protein [Bacillus sp. UMTAT18]KKC52093.1 hypothetical protein OA45_05616 [Bacillus sp. UMTAT18]